MTCLQVRVLGKLGLHYGEASVEFFPTRRVEELLGFLLLNQQVQHSREKLIEVLWPNRSVSSGRANLSTALWRLRTVFDQIEAPLSGYVETSRDWVRFAPSQPFRLDSAEFEQHLADAEQSASQSDRETSLRAAIALYRGGFCEGIYSDWCLLERERLERHYLRAQGQLMASLIARREYEAGISVGQSILHHDPLREEVHRALILCFWKTGQHAQAARQFQLCAVMLQDELHILPMPETIALYRRIITDRLSEAERPVDRHDGLPRRLRQAFEEFQVAADRLNALLESTSSAQPDRETIEAEAIEGRIFDGEAVKSARPST